KAPSPAGGGPRKEPTDMQTLLEIGLANAAAATVLAVVALVGARCCRHRAVTHALWLLVLVKLVTPPLVRVPLSWPSADAQAATAAPLVVLEDIGTRDRPGGDKPRSIEALAPPLL